jgi:hypothetical protein
MHVTIADDEPSLKRTVSSVMPSVTIVFRSQTRWRDVVSTAGASGLRATSPATAGCFGCGIGRRLKSWHRYLKDHGAGWRWREESEGSRRRRRRRELLNLWFMFAGRVR